MHGGGEEERWGNVAKIMGLVVTGTERQGRLVQGGETEAKGQKGKVQVLPVLKVEKAWSG